jgi:hypothetical protein
MPEDTQLSEHEDLTPEEEETAAFESEEEPDKEEEPQEPEEEGSDEEESEESEEDPEEEPEEGSEEAGSEEEESDEDVRRGEELLQQREKEEKERKEKEEEESRKAKEAEERRQAQERASQPLDTDTLKLYRDVVPLDRLPDTVEIDGKEMDLKGYTTDFPEAPVLASYAAKSVIDRLVENGLLVTADAHQQAMSDIENRFGNELFSMKVHSLVENASEIYQSDEFQGWYEKQDEKVKALFDSFDPKDHARVFNRFLKESGKAEADKKKKEAEDKARKEKEKRDKIYGAKKKKGSPSKGKALSPEDEEREAFESEDDE